jgi:tRNA threonylcarbamoyl adenosine modification protein (Sua5/YciO/YrdC/YwlC family)
MAQFFTIHPHDPQVRLIRQAAGILRTGAVMVYPTDSCYALGCMIGEKEAMERIRAIRGVDEKYHFTLVCRDVSEIAHYARVDNRQFRMLKSAFPGSYAFILEATKEVPRRLLHPRRRTIGVRIPDHPVALALLKELGEPVLSSTLVLPGDERPLNDPNEIRDRLERRVDLIIDAGFCGLEPTTVLDITGEEPIVMRQGKGELARLGLAA